MIILTKGHIMLLHRQLIEEFGGSEGLRDETLLDSAVSSPFQTFGGKELYPTILEKGARLGYCLIKNHAFTDGNKRIGTHAMILFLSLNGISLFYTQNELIDIIMKTASGEKSYSELLTWLQSHITDSI